MTEQDKQTILASLDSYCQAFADADAEAMQELMWFDDARFTEIEDHIPHPFGRETFLDIMDWIRNNAKPGNQMTFEEPQIFDLAGDVAYGVALQHITTEAGSGTSRVTFIFMKKDSVWKIIHGHFSDMPTPD
jgi:ketosteroid isomerase-like protein